MWNFCQLHSEYNPFLSWYEHNSRIFFGDNYATVSSPPMRAFMDDLSIMPSTISCARTLLSCCTIALKWAGLTFRADKSRSIVLIRGRPINSTPFSVSSPTEPSYFTSFITSIHSRPLKILGRIIDRFISDRLDKLQKNVLDGLNIIDTYILFYRLQKKLWFLQHLLIPRIQWPILIWDSNFFSFQAWGKSFSLYLKMAKAP